MYSVILSCWAHEPEDLRDFIGELPVAETRFVRTIPGDYSEVMFLADSPKVLVDLIDQYIGDDADDELFLELVKTISRESEELLEDILKGRDA